MISIVIPTINEEDSIGSVIDRIRDSMRSVGEPYEIIIVDTNSGDRTVDIARSKGCVVIEERQRGYGRAYKSGFAAAKGDKLVTLDADASYPPEAIPSLLSVFEKEGLDFITTNRFSSIDRGAMSRTHRFGNWIAKVAGGVLRKDILDRLVVRSDGFPFSEEIKIRAARSVRFAEVPIHFMERKGTKKLSTWRDGWNNLKFLIKLRFSRDI
ncbi:MAG: glycosyltransferase family 2 protein [Candidatus Thermoplasmatota archaeon]|nr:glycosyltransferase family 2 protein [Candidatus Thermoplasmatota archaeon]